MNPWETIDLEVYEKHMSLESVNQLQSMNATMKSQFSTYPVHSIMILGIAGGNGLEHIDNNSIHKVYGVDVNKEYLRQCQDRYPNLSGVFETVHTDLMQEDCQLPYADLLIANLLVEYIGYDCFQRVVTKVKPQYVSVVIQINIDESFVSDSPYLHAFDGLDEVHYQMEEETLIQAMLAIGYTKQLQEESHLPNAKKLVRLDFSK